MPLFRPTPYLLAGRPKTAPHEIPPPSSSLPAPRSADQADKYFRRVANENVKPGRGMRLLSVGGWVVGGGEFRLPNLGLASPFFYFLIPRLDPESSCVVVAISSSFVMRFAYTILLRSLCAFLDFFSLFCSLSRFRPSFALLSRLAAPHVTSLRRRSYHPVIPSRILFLTSDIRPCESTTPAVACTYMVLFADFGDKEHVFSPVSPEFL